MTRCNDCIRMLQLLKTRGKMNREQLADELECTKRQVLQYYNELVASGYDIESIRGKNGGYVLHTSSILPSSGFTPLEMQALHEGRVFMESHPEFLLQKNYLSAMDKLLSSVTMEKEENGIYISKQSNVSAAMKQAVELCESAKKEYMHIVFEYCSLSSNTWQSVKLQPYEILFYKESYYVLGYAVHVKEFRIYKFSDERMRNCKLNLQKFTRDLSFRLNDYIGESSIFRGELVSLDLEIYGMSARIISEQNVGVHTKKYWENDNVLHLTTMFEGKQSAISFLLSLRGECKLLSPSSLKKEMLTIVDDLYKCYAS